MAGGYDYGKDPTPEELAPGRGSRGLTLLEMFVVLLLLAIVAALAAPGTGRFLDSLNIRKQTQKIMATLRYSRLMSVTEGREVRLVVEAGNGSLMTLSGAVEKTFEFDFREDDNLTMDPAEVIFYPEGHVTPATLVFTKGDRVRTIVLDPLTALPITE